MIYLLFLCLLGDRMLLHSNSNLKHQTRLACGLIPLLNMLQAYGVNPEDALLAVGIRLIEFNDPAFTIPLEKELAIIDRALDIIQCETPSLALAKYYHLHNFSVLGLAIRSCHSLGDVFELFRRYPRLQWGICETLAEVHETKISFELLAGKTQLEQFLLERDMACVKTLLSEVLGEEFMIDQVSFSFVEPKNQSLYTDFFNCPVLFSQEKTAFTVDIAELEKTIPTADALSKNFYEAQCARLSAEIDRPFQYEFIVRDQLMRLTPLPSFDTLAKHIQIEPRTLQRLLKKEGTTFSDILREVRIKRATDLLQYSPYTHEQIATELGFNDAVAFSHAFKIWFSVSPREWLKQ